MKWDCFALAGALGKGQNQIPLSPPLLKGENFSSLWKREAGRDLGVKKMEHFDNQIRLYIMKG